jgi:AcrR family transcriptional regulator
VTERPKSRISLRKKPKQARSENLVSAILEAAVQVLEQEGAQRFTTARVADRAGVSVGSLYQYFPNKAAILFRLQSDEWRETSGMLSNVLDDQSQPPLARLRRLVHVFVQSECEEADVRGALNDAAPLYRDAPEAQEARISGVRAMRDFIAEVLPKAPDDVRNLAADLINTTLGEVGKSFSERERSDAEIATYADALADMLCGYLGNLAGKYGA